MNIKTVGVLYEEKSIYQLSLEVDFCFSFICWCEGAGKKRYSTQEIATVIFYIINSLFYVFIDQLGHIVGSSLVAQLVKHLPTMPTMWETRVNPWVGKISGRRKRQPTPVFLPGKSHGWWNLVGYSPWDQKESDTTERLHFTLGHINKIEKPLSLRKTYCNGDDKC